VDADQPSYLSQSIDQCLKRHCKSKTKKYHKAAQDARKDFGAFFTSVDGILSKPAEDILRRIIWGIAERTGMNVSKVAGAVKAKMHLAILRAASFCIRGCRERRTKRAGEKWGGFGDAGGLLAEQAPADVEDWD